MTTTTVQRRPSPNAGVNRKTSWASRLLRFLLFGLIGLALIIQLVPYGRSHTNPPITGEPKWDSAQTSTLFTKACADCHSNQTVWPWYSNVAPVSWLVQRDVDEGRAKFNVSEWGRPGKNEGEEAAEEIEKGAMPLWFYAIPHPEANLSAADKQALIAGLRATFGGEGEGSNPVQGAPESGEESEETDE